MSEVPASKPETVAAPAAPAVHLTAVSKIYRLYRKPGYRVLDLFGLCPSGPAYYTEHAALDDIELRIGRGEKVAIIGRNGAGKSTLLKIITQTLRPTTGVIEIDGTVSALLEIGTGFHPDFTGRQNVYSGFAHLGITGRRADELFDDVVDFSELEEYIDQPMKSYSTGMGARLMFSAATVLVPDIFVIDELLGVGDAYFAHKSYERMRQLCSSHGTTLLLVTHDIYSAMNICDRFIWIDRGRVKMDADGKTTVNAYEASIKEQEEERRRRRNAAAMLKRDGLGSAVLHVRLASRNGFALPAPLAIGTIELRFAGGGRRTLDVAGGDAAWTLFPEGNLGGPTTVAGRRCRCLDSHGSIYHKAEWAVTLPSKEPPQTLAAWIQYEGEDAVEVAVATDTRELLMRRTFRGAPGWRELAFSFVDDAVEDGGGVTQGEYGTGLVRIADFSFTDASGQPVTHCRHGGHLVVDAELQMRPALRSRAVTFAIVFYREGVALGAYAYRDRLELPEGDACRLRVVLDPLLLGSGPWLVTVGVAEADLYKQDYNPFFTLNDRWHHLVARGHELQVDPAVSVDSSAFLVHPATIDVRPLAAAEVRLDPVTPAPPMP